MYEILLSVGVQQELGKIRIYDRKVLLDAIEARLSEKPNVETKTRKPLLGLIPPFEAVLPVWQLRVGDYRVFYDVSEQERKVFVRAVRRKPPHKTTEEIL